MRTNLYEYLNFYKPETPHRVYLLKQIEDEARAEDAEGLAPLLDLVGQARAHDEETLRLEALWRGQSEYKAQYGPRAREIDVDLDRALAGLRGHLQSQVGLYPEDHPRRAAAAVLEATFFPGGLTAVTKLTFTAQHSEVGRILNEAKSGQAAQAIVLLDLAEPMARLDELWRDFGAELKLRPERVSADELKTARSFGLEMMAEVIISILARKPGERGLERRLKLLEPIERHNDRLRAYHKARVRGGDGAPEASDDIDPTGDEDRGEASEAA